MNSHLKKCVQKGLKKCDYSIHMIYVQSMDLKKLGQMLGSGGNEDLLVEDAIFLTEGAEDFLRSRSGFHGDLMLNLILRCRGKKHLRVKDSMALPIRDYCVKIVFLNNGIEGRLLFFGEDSDDSRLWCIWRSFGMEKVNLIECGSEVYEFIDIVRNEIREIHTDLNDAIPWI